jgi:hypothetical protein
LLWLFLKVLLFIQSSLDCDPLVLHVLQ